MRKKGTQGDMRKLLKLMSVLIILIEVKMLGVYAYVHIYQIITLSNTFITCQSYLNKVIF